MLRTLSQNKRFYELATRCRLDKEERAALVHDASHGRTSSSRELTVAEMNHVIKRLEGEVSASVKRMRSKALGIAKDIFDVHPNADFTQAHWDRLNRFVGDKWQGKQFHQLTYEELRNCVTALDKWREWKLKKALKQLLS